MTRLAPREQINTIRHAVRQARETVLQNGRPEQQNDLIPKIAEFDMPSQGSWMYRGILGLKTHSDEHRVKEWTSKHRREILSEELTQHILKEIGFDGETRSDRLSPSQSSGITALSAGLAAELYTGGASCGMLGATVGLSTLIGSQISQLGIQALQGTGDNSLTRNLQRTGDTLRDTQFEFARFTGLNLGTVQAGQAASLGMASGLAVGFGFESLSEPTFVTDAPNSQASSAPIPGWPEVTESDQNIIHIQRYFTNVKYETDMASTGTDDYIRSADESYAEIVQGEGIDCEDQAIVAKNLGDYMKSQGYFPEGSKFDVMGCRMTGPDGQVVSHAVCVYTDELGKEYVIDGTKYNSNNSQPADPNRLVPKAEFEKDWAFETPEGTWTCDQAADGKYGWNPHST